jgi:hypothetical protein
MIAMSEVGLDLANSVDVTASVFPCRPPRSIMHDDGSISMVIAETIDDNTHESIPVALMRTEHGYSGAGFRKDFLDGKFFIPSTRISAVVLDRVTREEVITNEPPRTYEKRIRKARQEMSKTLLATMQLTD